MPARRPRKTQGKCVLFADAAKLYIGYSKAVTSAETAVKRMRFFAQFYNAAFAERGISLPLQDAATVNEEDRLHKGKAIQEPIYGSEIKDRYGYLPSPFDEAVPRFLSELCFGDFATRKGLDVKRREMLILVCLAALGGADLQVKAHFLGARKVGNSDEELVCALVHASAYMGIPRLFNALNAVSDLLKESKEK